MGFDQVSDDDDVTGNVNTVLIHYRMVDNRDDVKVETQALRLYPGGYMQAHALRMQDDYLIAAVQMRAFEWFTRSSARLPFRRWLTPLLPCVPSAIR